MLLGNVFLPQSKSTTMQFDLPKELSSIIKVIGVGGGGSNAVNHMYTMGIKGVDFIVCNTDKQALDKSLVPIKIALGASLTEGLGAGSLPEVGKNAAIENIEEVKAILSKNTKMVFITAGMGGGTGTGAAPVIAKIAKEMDILTVGIVTVPFAFEGKKRRVQAEQGITELKANVDTLLIISNDKLREIYGNLKVREAFSHADNILTTAAKGIADIITTTLQINTDINDVRTVMKDSGVAIMGSASASGSDRAIKAVENALASPLLNDNDIKGARYVLLNVTCGTDEITMDELGDISDYIQDAAGQTAEIIKGYGIDDSLGDKINVTIVATGFTAKGLSGAVEVITKKPERIVKKLEDEITSAEVKMEPVIVPAPVIEVSLVEEKAEEKVNPLEPFLIIKKSEPQKEIEFEVVNTLIPEPVAVIETPVAVIAPVVEEPVAIEPEVIKYEEPEVMMVEEVVVNTTEEPVANLTIEDTVASEAEQFFASITEVPVINEAEQVIENKTEELFVNKVEESVINTAEQHVVSEVEEPTVSKAGELVLNEVEESFISKTEEPVLSKVEISDEQKELEKIQNEEQIRKAKERILKLKELSFKLKTPNGLTELENEPAYKRRNVNLDTPLHSSESQVSRFTLTQEEGEEKKVSIRRNNSFLDDNVD